MSPLAQRAISEDDLDIDDYQLREKPIRHHESADESGAPISTPARYSEANFVCNTFGKRPGRSPTSHPGLETTCLIDLKDCKAPNSQKHLLRVVDHLSDDMNRFVGGLLESLKGICLTRMSEKSI